MSMYENLLFFLLNKKYLDGIYMKKGRHAYFKYGLIHLIKSAKLKIVKDLDFEIS